MANKDFKVKNGLDIQTPLPVSMGGTGQTSTSNTLNSLLPPQSGNTNKVLSTDGTNTTWVAQATAYQRGGTASRPASPTVGDLYYNTDLNYFESYTANGWFPIAAAPGIPTGVTATNQGSGRAFNNGQMSVAFTPNSSGGAASSFIVTPSPSTSPSTFTGGTSPITVTGLASSTQYTYTVQATSPYGTSSASSASTGVTATTVPQAPTIGTATGGNAQASVTFTANATGGSAITSYTVTSSPGNITASGASSPITVTGLTNGTAYTFTVTATNANGISSASSASSSITPMQATAPSTIETLVIAGGGGGGGNGGGGGGAGGLLYTASQSISVSTQYIITVGSGGARNSSSRLNGSQGNPSQFGSQTSAVGGGYGGGIDVTTGGSGGSGGGGNGVGGAGTGTSGQGNSGGSGGYSGQSYGEYGGGGGGFSAAGGAATSNGFGGNGSSSYSAWGSATSSGENISSTYYFAGGGGGGGIFNGRNSGGSGGYGGGGSGSSTSGTGGVSGITNTGGGGGGGTQNSSMTTYPGGSGGSGIVIIRYSDTYTDPISYTGTKYTSGGYKYFKFTANGNITF